jgi:superfamily II DNA or RNA helicase
MKDKVTATAAIFNISLTFGKEEKTDYENLSSQIERNWLKLSGLCPDLQRGQPGFLETLRTIANTPGKVGTLARILLGLIIKRRELVYLAANRIPCATALVSLLIEDHRLILFSERIETADAVYAQLQQLFPGRIARYHSAMDYAVREKALEAYRMGEISVLISCRALDEGLNVPETDAGVIISSETGYRQRVQRIGRILRRTAGDHVKKIYFLYVEGAETPCHNLREPSEQDAKNISRNPQAFYLGYAPELGVFQHPKYEAMTHEALQELQDNDASAGQISNATHQFTRGRIRLDFLLSRDALLECRHLAITRAEREYYSAMLLLNKLTDR